jgi:hypothetical protein
VGSFAGAEDGSQYGPLVVRQWWGLGNEAVDMHGQAVGVCARGWGSRGRLGLGFLLAGFSAGRGQGWWSPSGGCLTSAGCAGRAGIGVVGSAVVAGCLAGGAYGLVREVTSRRETRGFPVSRGGWLWVWSFPSQWWRSAGAYLAFVTARS